MSEFVFKMPDIGEGIVEAEIVFWHVKAGDLISEDAPLADVMTDKATVEMTSPVSGSVVSIGCEAGEKIVIGADFVVFETGLVPDSQDPASNSGAEKDVDEDLVSDTVALESETLKTSKNPPAANVVEIPKPRLRIAPNGQVRPALAEETNQASTKPLASPAVRRKALLAGIPLGQIKGSGPKGRVLMEDLPLRQSGLESADAVARNATQSVAQGGQREKKVTGLRRLIAERMTASASSIPHFTYVEEVDVTQLEETRCFLNDGRSKDQPKLSLLHFVLLGVCRSVAGWPQCNAHFDESRSVLVEHASVHLGVATMTESGLMVPVIHNADKQSVWELASSVNQLSEGARNGTLNRDQLTGSTITITSLGALAGISTTPIINRPETAIIGPNKMMDRVVMQDGVAVSRKKMNISSSFDHRVVDGHDAAMLIQHLRGQLENPAALFV